MSTTPERRIGRIWTAAAQTLLGVAALAVVTFVALRLEASTEAAALLFLFVVVPVAIWARPVASVLVSILAILALEYFFTLPAFSFDARLSDPLDVVTVVAFAAAALIITPVMAAVRNSFRENAALRDQLRTIVDTIPTMVWSTVPDGADDFVNRTWLEYTGLSADRARDAGWQAAVHPEDRARVAAAWQAAAASGEPFEQELRLRRADGEYRWVLSRAVALRDDQHGIVRWYGTSTDIEDRKRAEEALRGSEERHARAMEASADGLWEWNPDTDGVFLSPRARQLYGIPDGVEIRTRADLQAHGGFHPEDRPFIDATIAQHRARGSGGFEMEYRVINQAGELRWARSRGKSFPGPGGHSAMVIGAVSDVTERRRAEEALRESEARFRSLTNLSSDWYWQQDENLRFTYLSSGAAHAASVFGKTRWELDGLVPLSSSWPEHQVVLAARQPFRDFECVQVWPDGSAQYRSVSGTPIFDEAGRFKGYQGATRDITERKQAEAALRVSEERYARAMEASGAGHWDWNLVTDEMFQSARMKELVGVPADREFRTRTAFLAHTPYLPGERERLQDAVEGCLTHSSGRYEIDLRVAPRPGEIRWIHSEGKVFRDAAGKPVRLTGSVTDITERRAAEESLEQSERRFRQLFENSVDAVFVHDARGRFVDCNAAACQALGYAREELLGMSVADIAVRLLSETERRQRKGKTLWQQAMEGEPGRIVGFEENHLRRKDGTTFPVEVGVGAIEYEGRRLICASVRETTERIRAQEELLGLERQLRQAQRLEAMGTLAGGIAHDFNNILGAILGYGEMALRGAPKGSRLRRDLDSIMTAGERGRTLVERILAFSRSSVDERVPVHVARVAGEALDQLAAKLPPGVTIALRLSAGRAAVMGDPTQVHQVLMNLATNAVQAMPSGGTLRVVLEAITVDAPRLATTGTVEVGDYVVLEVTDSGVGIPPDVLERIFDPFFTTKEVGVGTGLGLSLVHGIVTELGGVIDVVSTPGAGSTFTVYLPRAGDAVDVSEPELPEMPRGNRERVLIVDDEEPLVRIATETLEELGYRPVGFTSGSAALDAFRADPLAFDAVITDERMPGMSGSTLIREVRGIRAGIPTMLMSGYVGAAVANGAREAGADEVMKKPVSAQELATSLARVLRQ